MALRGGLPGYVWDDRLQGGRYRVLLPDGRLGRMVSAEQLQNAVTVLADRTGDRFARLAGDVVGGRLYAGDFQRAMHEELKGLYNQLSALARGGWKQMDFAAWGRNGRILRDEYKYLAGFAQDLADGKLTQAQAEARARLYAGKAYSRFWAEDRLLRMGSGRYSEEKWIDTGDKRECDDCERLAALGRVPVGTLPTVPGAGDTDCLGACRCRIEYYE